jgi:hypothetical protein
MIKVKLIGVTGIKHNISPIAKCNIKNKVNELTFLTKLLVRIYSTFLCVNIKLKQDTSLV